jgi:hypothetical protein
MIDETPTTTTEDAKTGRDETFEWTDESGNGSTGTSAAGSAGAAGREWLAQLQSMIENAATQAGPVLREVAAKAAELAAIAGEKAGPVAARAAELTAEAGHRIAERSRDFAADLRRDQAGQAEHAPADAGAAQPTEPMNDEAPSA